MRNGTSMRAVSRWFQARPRVGQGSAFIRGWRGLNFMLTNSCQWLCEELMGEDRSRGRSPVRRLLRPSRWEGRWVGRGWRLWRWTQSSPPAPTESSPEAKQVSPWCVSVQAGEPHRAQGRGQKERAVNRAWDLSGGAPGAQSPFFVHGVGDPLGPG